MQSHCSTYLKNARVQISEKTPFSIHSPIRGREGTERVFAEEWIRNPSIVWGLRHKPYQRKPTLETVPNANLGGGAKWDLRGIIIIGVKQTEKESEKNTKIASIFLVCFL